MQIGIRTWNDDFMGMNVLGADWVHGQGTRAVADRVLELVGENPAYLSFDIDCLDPAFAPGTGTPEAAGLTPREVREILRSMKGLNIVGGDVVEVAPAYDSTTNTAMNAAQVLFEILSLMAFSPALKT